MSEHQANGKSPTEWHDYVIEKAKGAENWYTARIKKKRWKAILFLFLTIVLTGAAGLLPIILEIWASQAKDGTGSYPISPAWASALLGLSALLFVWDRVGDLTSGWIRFARTRQKIENMREAFTLDWAAQNALTTPPSNSELILLCKTFVAEVMAVVTKETDEWAAAFQSALTELAKAAQEESKVKKPGALNVEVTNGAEMKDGWKLRVDGGRSGHYTGTQAVVAGLVPGLHVVRVDGEKDGQAKRAEAAVTVPADAVVKQTLTLT